MDKRRLVAEALRRMQRRKLVIEYDHPFDHARPFGPDNIGPYNWQVEFHNAGKDHPERLLMAANRVGKCVTYQTLIDTPRGKIKAGCLTAGDLVWSWDGVRKVPARIFALVRKPPEPIYRLHLSTGGVIECAADHLMLLYGLPPSLRLSYAPARRLLGIADDLPRTSSERGRSIRAEGGRRCSRTLRGSRVGYPMGRRSGDEQPRSEEAGDLALLPSPADARRRIPVSSRSDGWPASDNDSPSEFLPRPSSLWRAGRAWDRFGPSECSIAGTGEGSLTYCSRESPPLHAAAGLDPRSIGAAFLDQSLNGAWLASCESNNPATIIGYEVLPPQELYDFDIPPYRNYCAGGVVHHNTRTGAAEVAIHATGLYPDWWQGRRFDEPTDGWCGSETNEASRDIVQAALLGPVGQFGTGWIPGDYLVGEPTKRQAGIGNVVDTISVKHVSGGISTIGLKTYEQGEKTWQGTSKHWIWTDEEPPGKIYTEAQTRLIDKKGILFVTRTPLEGASDVVVHFMQAKAGLGIYLKNASWDDAPHLDEDEKRRLMASYPEHEVETRTSGKPMMGTGAVFPIADALIMCEPIELKPWYRYINGIDFGIDHPGAGAHCFLDPEGQGTFYVYDCYKAPGHTAVYHAAAMKKHGEWIPNAWPHDGLERDKGSGEELRNMYRRAGLYMLKDYATGPGDTGNHVEPALVEMLEWMRLGRFKVFRTLPQWFEEKRLYHRKDGVIVKVRDDILSATRYAFMMRRFARPKPSDQPIGSNSGGMPIAGRRRWDTG